MQTTSGVCTMAKWIICKDFDVEDFDADGIGDCITTELDWEEYNSEEELLKNLQSNMFSENNQPIRLNTLKEYALLYPFKIYKAVDILDVEGKTND